MPPYDPRPQPNNTLVQEITEFQRELQCLDAEISDSMSLWRYSVRQNEDDAAIERAERVYLSFVRKEKTVRAKLEKARAERTRRVLRNEFPHPTYTFTEFVLPNQVP
jgi:hypothetical protein